MTTNFSVLTNPQAASALLNLNRTNTSLGEAQERINTGLRIGSAKDDSATFAIALGMRSDIAGFKAIRENLSLGASTLGVASAGTNQIADQIKEIREKVVQASNNEQGRPLIQQSIDNAIEQIKNFVAASRFNGINIIDGDQDNAGKSYEVVSNIVRDGSNVAELQKIAVPFQDLSIEERNRGLGALKDLNVEAGKTTEITNERNDPVSVSVDFSNSLVTYPVPAGQEIEFNYVDEEGLNDQITFTTFDDADTLTIGGGITASAGVGSPTNTNANISLDLTNGSTVTAAKTLATVTSLSFNFDPNTGVANNEIQVDIDLTSFSGDASDLADFVNDQLAEQGISQFVASSTGGNNLTITDTTATPATTQAFTAGNSILRTLNDPDSPDAADVAARGSDTAIFASSAEVASAQMLEKLTNLATGGGPLAGLGFSFTNTLDLAGAQQSTNQGIVTVLRDLSVGVGQLSGFSNSDVVGNEFVTAAYQVTEAREGGLAQVSLQINDSLEAGDEIDVTFLRDDGIPRTFTFVIMDKNDTSAVSGELIDGTSNKYHLRYDEVIEAGQLARTPQQAADAIAAVFNATPQAPPTDDAGNFASEVGTFLGQTLTSEFSIDAQDDAVVITDLDQAFDDGSRVTEFNMNNAPGGTLDFDALLLRVDEAENQLKTAAGLIGAAEQALQDQSEFVDTLIKSVNDGVGTLVDANMAEESARFQALQVQQQLGLQALSIANANPQAILSLFQ